MKLTKDLKERICEICISECSDYELDGVPYIMDKNGEERELIIPHFSETFDLMCEKIQSLGFTKFKRCSLQDANLIIRVYEKLHHEHDDEYYSIYGADCYTRHYKTWATYDGCKWDPIDFTSNKIRIIFSQDDYVIFDKTKFIDIPVKIS